MINTNCIEFRRWMKELKSPTAKKTRERLESLHNKNARCCLGHACAANKLERTLEKTCLKNRAVHYEGNSAQLPLSLCEKLNINHFGEFTSKGILEVEKIVGTRHTYTSLMDMNDNTKMSTKEIAELIQKLARIEKKTKVAMFLEARK